MCQRHDQTTMTSMRSCLLLLALLLASGCGDDLHGDADAIAEAGEDLAPDPSSPGDPGDPPPPVPELCDRLLACVNATRPAELAALAEHYGSGSACWDAGPAEAALCIAECGEALEDRHRSFPRHRACMLCRSDDDCNTGAGEFCFVGGCELIEHDDPG